MSGYLKASILCQSNALPESAGLFHGMEVPKRFSPELLKLWRSDVEFLSGELWQFAEINDPNSWTVRPNAASTE